MLPLPGLTFAPVPVAASVEELLGHITDRRAMKTGDSKSGSTFELIQAGAARYVVKHMHVDNDWIQRCVGDLVGLPLTAWRAGLLAAVPDEIDHVTVGCVAGEGRDGLGSALVLHDVGAHLVPEGDAKLPLAQHRAFVQHMAALHARFWGFADDRTLLLPRTHRYLFFSAGMLEAEAERGWDSAVPVIAAKGWERFAAEVDPEIARAVLDLRDAPWPLVDALAATPATLIHGDWKAGNLGSRPDGRTILLDWAYIGEGAGCSDLAWYLALNAARVPEAKEAAVDAYRSGLEARGIATDTWFERQWDLALLGALVQFGWEKALGSPAELDWWLAGARRGLARL